MNTTIHSVVWANCLVQFHQKFSWTKSNRSFNYKVKLILDSAKNRNRFSYSKDIYKWKIVKMDEKERKQRTIFNLIKSLKCLFYLAFAVRDQIFFVYLHKNPAGNIFFLAIPSDLVVIHKTLRHFQWVSFFSVFGASIWTKNYRRIVEYPLYWWFHCVVHMHSSTFSFFPLTFVFRSSTSKNIGNRIFLNCTECYWKILKIVSNRVQIL